MKKARTHSGIAMLLVLIAVAVAVVMGTSYVSSAAIKTAGSRNFRKACRARYLAESGMQHALYVLWTDPTSLASTSAASPMGPYAADNTPARYRLWATPDAYEIGLYHITARGTCGGVAQEITWRVYRTPPYDQVMLSNNPTGYWRFTSGTGYPVVWDYSGGHWDLTCFNGASLDAESGVTGGGTALQLDGIDDYLSRGPTPQLQIKTDLTISVWFNVDQLPGDSNKAVLVTCSEPGESPNKNALYQLAINSSGQLEYMHEYSCGRDQTHVFDTIELSPGTWHNLVVVREWKDAVIKVYLQGQLVESWTFLDPGNPKPNSGKRSGLYVGSAWGEESFFGGRMDELGVMDHVLSEEEIWRLYRVGGMPEMMEVRSCGN